jgi:hypothetical protein
MLDAVTPGMERGWRMVIDENIKFQILNLQMQQSAARSYTREVTAAAPV